MPIVKFPDGSRVRFPDDMTPDQIQAVVMENQGQTGDASNVDAAKMITRGMTGGLSDYAGAAGRYLADKTLGKDTTYNDALKTERADIDAYTAENPWKAYGGQIVGGITSPLFQAVSKVMGIPVNAMTRASPSVAQSVAQGGGKYAELAWQGAGIGGFAGAASARGEGGGVPTFSDLMRDTKRGAAIGGAVSVAARGAAIGGAVSVAARGAVNVAGKVASGARGVLSPIIDRLPQKQGSAAARVVAKRLQADGFNTVDDAERALADMGDEAVLADLGKGTARLADNMAQTPGRTAQLAEETFATRNAGMPSRLVASTKANISPKSFHEEFQALSDRQRIAAAPLYEKAFAAPTGPTTTASKVITSPKIERLLTNPKVQAGIRKGISIIRDEADAANLPMRLEDYALRRNPQTGQIEKYGTPTLRLLDAAKRGLDDMINSARDGVTGKIKWTQQLRAVDQLRSSLVDELDNATGGANGLYAQARAAWAGPAKLMDAMNRGRRFVSGDEEITSKVFNALSQSEKEAYRTGVAREMVAMIRKSGSLPQTVKSALKDTGVRQKLKIILPTEQQFNRFVADIQKEVTFQNTSNAIRGGSQTFQRLEESAAAGLDSAADIGGAAINLAHGNPVGAVTQTMRWAINVLRRAKMPENVRDQVGRMLVSNDPADKAQAFQMLRDIQRQTPGLSFPASVSERAPMLAAPASMTGSSTQGQRPVRNR